MQKEINFYKEITSEHRLQENGKGPVSLSIKANTVILSFGLMIIDKEKNLTS